MSAYLAIDEKPVTLALIPVLEETSQWILWDRQMRHYLESVGFGSLLDRHLNEPAQITREADIAFYLRKEAWHEKQGRALGTIKQKLNTTGLDTINGLAKLDQVLLKLKKQYRPSGSVQFQHKAQLLENLTLRSCKGVQDFPRQLTEVTNELAMLGDECKMPTAFLVNKFLCGLGPEFDTWLTGFYSNHSLISVKADLAMGTAAIKAVTFEEAVFGANEEEQRMKGNKEAEKAFVAKTAPVPAASSSAASASSRPTCTGCGRLGHEETVCFQSHPDLKKRHYEQKDKERAEGKRRRAASGKPAAAAASDKPTALMAFSGNNLPGSLELDSFGFMASSSVEALSAFRPRYGLLPALLLPFGTLFEPQTLPWPPDPRYWGVET